MYNKKLQVWLPLLFSLVMIIGMMIGFKLRENTHPADGFLDVHKSSPLQQVLELIDMKYVDAINTDTLAGDVIKQVLSKLDPHSVYLPPVDFNRLNEELQGVIQGIGADFYIFNDTANVIDVLENGPSARAGLLIGDQILQVSDSLIVGNNISSDRIKRIFRGLNTSKVRVTILRGQQKKLFTINRVTIPIPSLDAAYMIKKDAGIIRINTFSQVTYEQFMKALEDLQSQGMKNLILDLRGNTGGILNEAVDIADEFLSDGKLIVYTKVIKY